MRIKQRVQRGFRPKLRSRHGTHSPLRDMLPKMHFKSVVRLGSTTALVDDVTSGGNRIECNTIEGVKNSASKLLMKKCFTEAGVITAPWWTFENEKMIPQGGHDVELTYPIVAKYIFGSRCTGNYKLDNEESFNAWRNGKNLSQYIFEKFLNYNKEYRLHVTQDGCFYTCRKMLKADAPQDKRWFRNDSNSVWIMDTNPSFEKPVNWETIIQECVKALKAVKLDIGAIDVRVQSAKNKEGKVRDNPEFVILETNSAASFGDITLKKYVEEIPKVLTKKYEQKGA